VLVPDISLIIGCLAGFFLGLIIGFIPGANIIILFALGLNNTFLIGVFATASITSKIIGFVQLTKDKQLYRLNLINVAAKTSATSLVKGYITVFSVCTPLMIFALIKPIRMSISPVIGLIVIALVWFLLIRQTKNRIKNTIVFICAVSIGWFAMQSNDISANIQALIFGLFTLETLTNKTNKETAEKTNAYKHDQLDYNDRSTSLELSSHALISGLVGGIFAGLNGPNNVAMLSKESNDKIIVTVEDRQNYIAKQAGDQVSKKEKKTNKLQEIANAQYASGISSAISIILLGLSVSNNPRSAEGMFMQLADNSISPIVVIFCCITMIAAGVLATKVLPYAIATYNKIQNKTNDILLVAIASLSLVPKMLSAPEVFTSMMLILVATVLLHAISKKLESDKQMSSAALCSPVVVIYAAMI
jgi:hypothetical protein